ncbi:MAG: T9SS type A sorting domain-containing protein, partial [Candidatus Marinimicrobia bacterium]|nr:T9SS type A sorting domain-containing protein [Candidatus Neomarinimicrobiota bacterium]
DTYSEVIISESALAGDTLIANVSLSDDLGNEWEASQAILIEPYKEPLAAPILAVHSAGFADASVAVKVIDFFALTGDDYEVYFDRQHYYMDVDGAWKETNYPDSVGKALGTAMDVSPSTITGIAMTSPIPGTRDLMLTVDIVSTDYDYAEGVKLTFPLSVVINSATSEDGITAIIDDLENTVLFGAEVQDSTDLTGGGVFSGGELLQVNVDTPSLPLDVDYIIYDDGWATLFCADPANAATCESYGITDAVVVNAEGTFTISELAYIFKTEDHWNLRNLTTSSVLYEDMTEMGTFNNGGAHEGFVVRVEGTYDEPLDFESYAAVDVNGSSTADDYHIVGYYTARWARSARCREPDVWGAGTDDLSLLEKDIQLRFTGVYDDPVVIGNQTLHPIKPGTGSIATFIGSRYCIDLEDHPMANDVSTERNADGQFLIRIPFEVWDVESDPPKQINFLVYDRVQHPVESIDFYAFNPVNRMYCYILHTPYDATHIADVGTSSNQGGTDVDSLTWGLIFYETNWASGDTVTLRYIGPIQRGVDLFTFTTLGLELDPDFDTPESFVLSQNYPNPFNPNTTFQYDLPTATNVVFVIYDILGREIVRLVDAPEDAGPHQVIWTGKDKFGRDLASGVYIYRLVTPEYTKSIKMLLLK